MLKIVDNNDLHSLGLIPLGLRSLYANYEINPRCFHRKHLLLEGNRVVFTCWVYSETNSDYENSITGLIGASELLEELEYYKQKTEDYHCHGMIKVGYFDLDDLLLYSLNSDEIFVYKSMENTLDYICRSIYQFFNLLEETIIYQNLRTVKVGSIYRNWGDLDWKVVD